MKKASFIAAAALLFSAGTYAQTEPTPTPAPEQKPVQETPVTTTGDKYNNWTPETYKMQAMPEALTMDKVFPAIGKYEIANADGTKKTVTVTLDETNKGIVWIDGLEAGLIKANLRKSPATYKIPAQKLGEDKDAKAVAEGVMIFDKESNQLNICIGCTFNAEDPALVFTPSASETEATEVKEAKDVKNKKTTAKVAKVKPVHYTGVKIVETTAAANPVQ